MFLRNKLRIADESGKGYGEISNCVLSIHKTFAGYRMQFTLTLKPIHQEESPCPTLVGLNVDLSVIENGAPLLLGRLIDDLYDESRQLKGHEFSNTKYLDIRDDDFIRIIDRTHRADIEFEFAVRPILQGIKHKPNKEIGNLIIPQSKWLQLINSLERDRFEIVVIRIPTASSHLHVPFSDALDKIREAERQYLRGDWNAACASCRAAWRTVLSSTPTGKNAIDHLLDSVTSTPQRKNFAKVLAKGLHDIQNAAVHLEGDVKTATPPADMTADDALLCIHWYSTMIGYISSVYLS